MEESVVSRCARCGMEERHAIHMIKDGHDFVSSDAIICAQPGCFSNIKNNAWAKTRSGWFFQKDGRVFCTDHIPAWVHEWRAKKQKRG